MNESVQPGSSDGTFPESFGFLLCMNVGKGKSGQHDFDGNWTKPLCPNLLQQHSLVFLSLTGIFKGQLSLA